MDVDREIPIRCPQCGDDVHQKFFYLRDKKLYKCSSCNLVYSIPREVPIDLYDSAYSQSGEYSNYLLNHNSPKVTWAMKRFLHSTKVPGKLLDIGCSTGVFLNAAIKKGWMVEGIEISESAGKICKKNTGANIFIGKVEDFPTEHRFDAITAWEVLEHTSYPIDFIEKAKKLLRKGGILCLSVPNWDSPWTRNSKLIQHWPPYHLSFWTPQSLKTLFSIEDFKIVDISQKPFAWSEEVGQLKWFYLPISLFRSFLLQQKGMHIYIKLEKK